LRSSPADGRHHRSPLSQTAGEPALTAGAHLHSATLPPRAVRRANATDSQERKTDKIRLSRTSATLKQGRARHATCTPLRCSWTSFGTASSPRRAYPSWNTTRRPN